MEEPLLTVVIPTRNRPGPLARCLRTLRDQRVDGSFEIVVVDDGSSAAAEIEELVAATPHARLRRITHAGSATARNEGVHEARAPVVLFLDDDCEASPGWVATLGPAARNGVAAGPGVNPEPGNAIAEATQTVLDYLTEWSLTEDGSTNFAPTYNIGCRREIVLAVPFDESYVNAGADRDWCARLQDAGHAIVIEPGALVAHRQQNDLRGFWNKHRDYGLGSSRFRRRRGQRRAPSRFYFGLVREGFARGIKPGLFVCVSQLATATGYAADAVSRKRED